MVRSHPGCVSWSSAATRDKEFMWCFTWKLVLVLVRLSTRAAPLSNNELLARSTIRRPVLLRSIRLAELHSSSTSGTHLLYQRRFSIGGTVRWSYVQYQREASERCRSLNCV
eukprot:scaffold258953_cov36-Prasinocladus_malaysianus.AAC.1